MPPHLRRGRALGLSSVRRTRGPRLCLPVCRGGSSGPHVAPSQIVGADRRRRANRIDRAPLRHTRRRAHPLAAHRPRRPRGPGARPARGPGVRHQRHRAGGRLRSSPWGTSSSATWRASRPARSCTSSTELGLDERGGIVVTTPTGTPFAGGVPPRGAGPRRPRRRGDLGGGRGQGRRRAPADRVVRRLPRARRDPRRDRGHHRLRGPGGRGDGRGPGVQRGRGGRRSGSCSRRWGLAGRSLRLLVFSFAFAVAVVAVLRLAGQR